MINKILIIILLSVLSSIFYRLGGASKIDQEKEFGWIPTWFRELPKKRDVGCALMMIAGALVMGVKAPFLAWFFTFGFLWGALSTYWDWMWGYDNHWFHGFMIGIAFFPLVIWGNITVNPFLIKSILLGIALGGWSGYVDEIWQPARSDIWSELGRGFFIPLLNIIYKIWR